MSAKTTVRTPYDPQGYPQPYGTVRNTLRTAPDQHKHQNQPTVRTHTLRTVLKNHVSAGQKPYGQLPYYVGGAWTTHATTPPTPVDAARRRPRRPVGLGSTRAKARR